MQAITYAQYGGPEVLRLTEVELPQPAAGQVLVRVRAASVNPIDVKQRRGDMAAVNPARFPVIPGIDLAGVVDAVGDDPGELAPGDEVLGVGSATYAQYALASTLVRKPAGLSWELAASIPVIGETAARVLRLLEVSNGQTLLIYGAAGTVGSLAAQLASSRGVTVIGATGPAGEEAVRSLGVEWVPYGEDLVQRARAIAPQGIDAALDTAGRGALAQLIELTGGPDRVLTIADMGAEAHGVRFTGGSAGERAFDALGEIAAAVSAGTLRIPLWRTYPLAQASSAHADIEAGAQRGKIVLLP